MKSAFSKSWVASKQPRKQRKYVANAPNHLKRKMMAANLDKPLKEKYGRRNLEVRKGDEVKIMKGKFKGKQGKISVVDVRFTRVQIEGVSRTKAGGEKIPTWIAPSNLKIMSLELKDNRRLKKSDIKEEKKTETKETKGSKK